MVRRLGTLLTYLHCASNFATVTHTATDPYTINQTKGRIVSRSVTQTAPARLRPTWDSLVIRMTSHKPNTVDVNSIPKQEGLF